MVNINFSNFKPTITLGLPIKSDLDDVGDTYFSLLLHFLLSLHLSIVTALESPSNELLNPDE